MYSCCVAFSWQNWLWRCICYKHNISFKHYFTLFCLGDRFGIFTFRLVTRCVNNWIGRSAPMPNVLAFPVPIPTGPHTELSPTHLHPRWANVSGARRRAQCAMAVKRNHLWTGETRLEYFFLGFNTLAMWITNSCRYRHEFRSIGAFIKPIV